MLELSESKLLLGIHMHVIGVCVCVCVSICLSGACELHTCIRTSGTLFCNAVQVHRVRW